MKYKIQNEIFEPIKMGDEGDWYFGDDEDSTCGDCGVPIGAQHLEGCDIERCPRCKQQLISCECGEIIEGNDL